MHGKEELHDLIRQLLSLRPRISMLYVESLPLVVRFDWNPGQENGEVMTFCCSSADDRRSLARPSVVLSAAGNKNIAVRRRSLARSLRLSGHIT